MVEGKGTVVKNALLVVNFFILVCGISVFAVGVWALADMPYMERFLGTDLYVSSASVLIAAGTIVVIISFIGCFGAIKEIKWMIIILFSILLLAFIIMLAAEILIYENSTEVDKKMRERMLETIPLYKNETEATKAWDSVQEYFKCCGLNNNFDYNHLVWRRMNPYFDESLSRQVPESCCLKRDQAFVTACKRNPIGKVFPEDCFIELKDFIKGHAMILGFIGILISSILLIGMMLSGALFLMIHLEPRNARHLSIPIPGKMA